ncbi:uncharacterized protein [Euphorbia lathyris]|uniref:uncharacterized protein n=1 Tax=Euphorbia lathyris TaxID=212925 RepID=UPI00331343DD
MYPILCFEFTQYLVKSGYKVALGMVKAFSNLAAPSMGGNHFWSLAKYIHTVWCVAKNVLPCYNNLSTKGINVEGMRCFCGSNVETLLHLFKVCKVTRLYWKQTNLLYPVYKILGSDCLEWFATTFNLLSWKEMTIFSGLISSIWYERNKIIHRKKRLGYVLSIVVQETIDGFAKGPIFGKAVEDSSRFTSVSGTAGNVVSGDIAAIAREVAAGDTSASAQTVVAGDTVAADAVRRDGAVDRLGRF